MSTHSVPPLPLFHRMWLLTRTSTQLHAFVTDLFAILDGKSRGKRARNGNPLVLTSRPLLSLPDVTVYFDGSFQGRGAGVGVYITTDMGCARISVPVFALDA